MMWEARIPCSSHRKSGLPGQQALLQCFLAVRGLRISVALHVVEVTAATATVAAVVDQTVSATATGRVAQTVRATAAATAVVEGAAAGATAVVEGAAAAGAIAVKRTVQISTWASTSRAFSPSMS